MTYFISSLEKSLGRHFLYRIGNASILTTGSILLLDNAAAFDPAYICIASPAICLEVLKTAQKGCLLSTGNQEEFLKITLPEGLTLLVTDFSLFDLNNHLNRFFLGMYSICSRLSNTAPYTLPQLVKMAHKLTGGTVILMDDKLNFLYDKITPSDDPLVSSLLFREREDSSALYTLFHKEEPLSEPVLFKKENVQVIIIPLPKAGGYLLFVGTVEEPGLSIVAFKMAELCEPLLLNRSKRIPNKDFSFQLLFTRIMNETTESDDSLMLMLKNLPNPPKKNMRLILIRSEQFSTGDDDADLLELLVPVKEFFSDSNIAVMPDEIVILLSSETQYCPLEFETDELGTLLKQHHAISMVGNPFTSIMALRVIYRQCHRMFPIAMAVKLDGENRCMRFSRYTQYNVIDICAKSVQSILGWNDIVILCHPGVLTLTRYDRAYGTNLREVMFRYLMNDRSIARTSSEMFMHRNTTIYKIKKIEELIGESMDDPYLRHNLIFSCLLLRYRELYQKEGISLSLFERPQKKKKP